MVAATKVQESPAKMIDLHLRQMYETLAAQPVPARLIAAAEALAVSEAAVGKSASRKR